MNNNPFDHDVMSNLGKSGPPPIDESEENFVFAMNVYANPNQGADTSKPDAIYMIDASADKDKKEVIFSMARGAEILLTAAIKLGEKAGISKEEILKNCNIGNFSKE